MKKHLLSLFALASMVFASSCTSEEIVSQSTGNEVSVTFKAELRSDVKSRMVGENAHQIDQVEFAVYDENGNYLSDLYKTATPRKGQNQGEDPNKMYAEINVVLVKGQTYSFAFWAQDKDYTAYDFAPATATVSIDYDQTANNYSADAFFAKINDFTVTGTFEQTVTLKRPFAQVNFLTTATDLDLAEKAGFEPEQSSIVVENAATSLNILTGDVDGSEKATFTLADVLDTETTTIKDSNNSDIKFEVAGTVTEFRYMATAYFLPTEATGKAQITASMSVKGNTSKTVDLTAAGITAQRNYRTNIYGNLLTSNGQFKVVIDPIFDGDHSVSTDEFTETYTSVNAALIANKDNTDAATYNVEAAEGQTISNLTITIPDDTKAESLIFNLEDLAENATITITNDDNDTDSYNKPVVVEVPAGANLGKLTINLPNAHVTLKNGTYSDMEVTTSNTTLEVGNGTVVTALTVKQGNVRIAEGGKVEAITNSTGKTLYILNAGGTHPATLPENTIVIYEDTKHTYVMNNMYSVDSKMEDLFSYAAVIGVKDITISLKKGVEGDVTIKQTADVDIVIDGCENKFDGTFYIHGNARNTGAETLTFKNIKFEHADGDLDFISSNSTGAVERYAHNVTVENCTFTGNGNGDVVGMRYRQAYNMVVKNSTFTNMHSLMWATGGSGITLDGVTVTDSKSGVSFATALNVAVNNSNLDVQEHGIRADGSVVTNLVVKNTTINATTPIFIRNITAAYNVTLEGDVKLNATGAYNVVFTKGTDDLKELEAPAEGTYSITGAADSYNIYPMEEGAPMNASSEAQLSSVITAGATTINLAEGTYKIPAAAKGNELTISGTEDTKIDITSGLTYVNGAEITFEGVTIQSAPDGAGYNKGFADMKDATFDDCVIDGTIGLDFSCEFNRCTFNVEGNYYNVWTWGAGTATFNKCTFNCDGKALLVYANVLDNGTYHQTVNITECTFNDNGDDTVTGKAAIEITNTYTPIRTYDVIIEKITVNGFTQTVPGAGDFNAAYGSVEGSNIGTNVWGNKCQLPNTQINVVIDDVDVY